MIIFKTVLYNASLKSKILKIVFFMKLHVGTWWNNINNKGLRLYL